MYTKKFRKACKIIAIFVALNLVVEIAFPTFAYALTGGPSMPEFSSFEPVATTNMVSEFSGDFTYNIPLINVPGANGGGYPLSLSYHSGASIEEEASWVGYGWTLNPGAINRAKRGLPDDWNGLNVKYWNKTVPNRTATAGFNLPPELFSMSIPLSINGSITYNNYKGFSHSIGAGLALANGLVSLGYNLSSSGGSFDWRINPGNLLNISFKKKNKDDEETEQQYTDSEEQKQEEETNEDSKSNFEKKVQQLGNSIGSQYIQNSFSDVGKPTNTTGFSGESYRLNIGFIPTPAALEAGWSIDMYGVYSTQRNTSETNRSVYGYMYSCNATAESVMDYHSEKSSTYNKRDVFIGIPVSDADMYSISGEGVGGGFRLHQKKAGHFHPAGTSNSTVLFEIGAEVEAGFNNGGGTDFQIGSHSVRVGEWSALTEFADASDFDEPVFFRFNNDLGGYMDYGNPDEAQSATVSCSGAPGVKSGSPSLGNIKTILNDSARVMRSSHIAYHTNEEIEESLTYNSDEIRYNAYCKDEIIHDSINRSDANLSDQIGEISTVNEDGYRYTYGLPIYSRCEKSMSYNIEPGTTINNFYTVEKNITGENKSIIGEESNAPYATQYLLTEITSRDYIDRTNNGPSEDDFGEYVRFAYHYQYGSANKTRASSADTSWYKWRIPYNQLLYQRNMLSDHKDDYGSVTEGEKEICYLDSIITKTHVAVFVKSARADALGAVHNRSSAANSTAKGNKELLRLDAIKLYAKEETGLRLIKTVRFEYDYSTFPGLPNSNGSYPSNGKLTLKKIWFEYNGIYNLKISPYEFHYKYPTTSDANYPGIYDSFENYGAGLAEEPDYSVFNIDAWSNYQANGGSRYNKMQPWLDQTPASSFDPAAWQLKRIVLPTGGEIHVQYEQDDYSYVQDQIPHVMVPIDSEGSSNTYYLDLSNLDISTNDYAELENKIRTIYINNEKRLYFKFLYRLIGDVNPTLSDCSSEYFDGYVTVKDVGYDIGSSEFWIQLGNPNGPLFSHGLPKHVCQDFVKTNRSGILSGNGNCGCNPNNVFEDNDPLSILDRLVNLIGFSPLPNTQTCKKISEADSYFKIPYIKDKKGGGIRVKRLLLYDKGIGTGTQSLYGNEYFYVFQDTDDNNKWKSSGVATNEPSAMREENVLVGFIERGSQSFFNKIVAGIDKEQSEGPIGESFLPSPSIGYSRVVVKNIHSGKTSPGYSIKEFYTAKDYPFEVDYTTLEPKNDYFPGYTPWVTYSVNNTWMAQGFVFKNYNMHGQVKGTSTYSGVYNYSATNGETNSANVMVSSENMEYFEPNEDLPVISDLYELKDITKWNDLEKQPLGKEVELIFESRKVQDFYDDNSYELDADVGFAGPIPLPFLSIIPYIGHIESEIYTHATSKVINYPVIVKRVISKNDNIVHITENKAFDKYTGKPLVTINKDGFDKLDMNYTGGMGMVDGSYASISVPASMYYDNFKPKALNERMVIKGSSNSMEVISVGSNYYLSLESTLEKDLPKGTCGLQTGDLVRLVIGSTNIICYIGESFSNHYKLHETYFSDNTLSVYSLPISVNTLEVLRSGNNNNLSKIAGQYTIYGDSVPNIEIDTIPFVSSGRTVFADSLNTFTSFGLGGAYNELDTLFSNINGGGNDSVSFDIYNDSVEIHLYVDGSWNCTDVVYGDANGSFDFDTITGEPVYYAANSNNEPQYLSCYTFKTNYSYSAILENVIASSASIFSDEWNYNTGQYYPFSSSPYNLLNEYEDGSRGKWRQSASYVYRDSIANIINDTGRIYRAGMYDLELFSWDHTGINNGNHWLRTNLINHYSPNGALQESQNILGIKNIAKYGYKNTVQYIVAANCDYEYGLFESFENTYSDGGSTYLEDGILLSGGDVVDTTAHTGKQSFYLLQVGDTSEFHMQTIPPTPATALYSRGIRADIWLKKVNGTIAADSLKLKIEENGSIVSYIDFEEVARIGEWTLFEAKGDPAIYSFSYDMVPVIVYRYAGSEEILIDDVRFQPLDSEMMSYVYDTETHNIVAVFDDQHFGLLFQYNSEGKLVRKLKETMRGVKTIHEKQYNTALKGRS